MLQTENDKVIKESELKMKTALEAVKKQF